jgi:WD40 repeat protein
MTGARAVRVSAILTLALAGGTAAAPPGKTSPPGPALALEGHTAAVQVAALNADGSQVATLLADGTAQVWDVATGKKVRTLATGDKEPLALAGSPDGKLLAITTGDNGRGGHAHPDVRLLSWATGEEERTLRGDPRWGVGRIVFSGDGKLVACVHHGVPTGTYDKETLKVRLEYPPVVVWEVATGQEVARLSEGAGEPKCAAFSADGKTLATVHGEGVVKLWQVAGGREVETKIKDQGQVGALAFGPDGARLYVSSPAWAEADGKPSLGVRVWNVAGGTPEGTLAGGGGPLAPGPDGRQLATAGPLTGVKVWDLATGKEALRCQATKAAVAGLGWSGDGKRLVAAEAGGARVFDAATGDEVMATPGVQLGYDTALAVSGDGRRLAITEGSSATVWAMSGAHVRTVRRDPALGGGPVALSRDGKRLAWAGQPPQFAPDRSVGQVTAWDVETGKRLAQLAGLREAVNAVKLSPDGERLAVVLAGEVRVVETATGKAMHTVKADGVIALSPDGKYLAGPQVTWEPGVDQFGARKFASGVLKVWEFETGKEVASVAGLKGPARALAYDGDGRVVRGVVARADLKGDAEVRGDLVAWEDGKEISAVPLKQLEGAVLSPDGQRLVTRESENARLWGVGHGEPLLWLARGGIRALAFTPDGRDVVALRGGGSEPFTLALLSTRTPLLAYSQSPFTAPVLTVGFSGDGKRLAAGGHDRALKVWDEAGKEVWAAADQPGAIQAAAFSGDGVLACACGDPGRAGVVKVWDAAGKELRTLKGPAGTVRGLAFGPDGTKLAASSDDRRVHVCEADTGKVLVALPAQAQPVTAVAFSPDGKWLAGATFGGVRVWDAATGKERWSAKGHEGFVNAVAYSPDGTKIATGGADWSACLWDAADGKELKRFTDLAAPVRAVAFDRDGKRLAAGGGALNQDGPVFVWDVATGEVVSRLEGHGGPVAGLAFDPAGRLATAGWDRAVKVWNLPKPPDE